MAYMIELHYRCPADPGKESNLTERVMKMGGRLDYREVPRGEFDPQNICLTYEFDSFEKADTAAQLLRREGHYVEGPQDYPDG